MPGHKRNEEFLGLGLEAVNFDITEIYGMDNLNDSSGIISESQNRCANLFGADESFYLVNGSTVGIVASILACVSEGDSILVARGSHKSVFSGIIYAGATPVYVYPEINQYGFQLAINPKDIENEIIKNRNIKACIITSPTYEGVVSDVEAIANICHENGVILIVDEAHGAHFKFSDSFPKTALEQGADIAIQSFHKTLLAFTQSAVLHVKSDLINRALLKKHLSMLQSSSPSYLLMLGLDNCVKLIAKKGEKLFIDYCNNLKYIREALRNCKNIKLICTDDIGKIVFYISREIDTIEIEKMLREKYKIEIELSAKHHMILMTSIADKKEGFLRLIHAILEIDEYLQKYPARKASILDYPKPIYKLHPKDAINCEFKKCNIKNARGQVSGDFFAPFPPGIPLLVPGEEITEEMVKYISQVYGKVFVSVI